MLIPPLLFSLLLFEAHPSRASPAADQLQHNAIYNAILRARQFEPQIPHTESQILPSSTTSTEIPSAESSSGTPTEPSSPVPTESIKQNPIASSQQETTKKGTHTSQVLNLAHIESPATPSTTSNEDNFRAHTEVPVPPTPPPPAVTSSAHIEKPAPVTSQHAGPQPQIPHAESEAPEPWAVESAHVEEPAPTTKGPSERPLFKPHMESAVATTIAPYAHIESSAPPTSEQSQQGGSGSGKGASSGGGIAGAIASAAQHAASSSPQKSNSSPEVNAEGETLPSAGGASSPQSASTESSPDSSPESESESIPSPIAIPAAGEGTLTYGSHTFSYSANPSAIAIGSQTVSTGQTLTIDSTPVVVSASGGSLYLRPATTPTAYAQVAAGSSSVPIEKITATLSDSSHTWTKIIEATRNSAGNLVAVTSQPNQKVWATSTKATGKASSSTGSRAHKAVASATSRSSTFASITASGSPTRSGKAAPTGAGSRNFDCSLRLAVAAVAGAVVGVALLL